MKITAGTLLYRINNNEIEVLLVHPSGNYNKKNPWSIPKGHAENGETLERTARRETQEETGIIPEGLTPIGYIDYRKSKKRVYCWIGYVPSIYQIKLSWEVDQAKFFNLIDAKQRIHQDQVPFILRLGIMI